MDTHYYLRGESLIDGRGTRDVGTRIPLTPEPNTFALGLKARVPLSPAGLDVLLNIKDRETAEFIPQYNIRVLRTERRDRAIETLSREPAVDFATPVFRQSRESEDLLLVTNQFIVQFLPDVSLAEIEEYNARFSVEIVRALTYAPNTYVLRAPSGTGGQNALDLANTYFLSGLTLFSHPDFVTRKHFRAVAERARPARSRSASVRRGEFSSQQWHLDMAKITDAWGITRGDPNIVVAILDDGVDTAHPELAGKCIWQFDYESHVSDAKPKLSSDKHGTACAGVAVAAGVKASGSAPGCKLIVVRTPSNLGVSDEAKMFQDAVDNGADVISCSWGPGDGTGSVDPLPDATRVAIHYCQTNGRGGKGTSVCWAAGNGNELVSNDGYASNSEVMAIAATTSNDTKAWYSDFGPEICICAPSSGDTSSGEKGIFTTDRLGAEGYNPGTVAKGDAAGSYYNAFGGTSSATPLVAGVVGLMLSANQALTPSEIREILESTADKVGASSDYDTNGHSQFFGFGRVNALAAVQEAKDRASGGGGGGTPAPASQVTITAVSSTAAFDGEPPQFEVDPGSNGFYQVEVVTQSELFDENAHGGERGETNYFASWDSGPFMAASPYTLPQDAWERLKSAEHLYYRAWTSSSADAWVDTATSLEDADAANAPSIEITGGMSGGGTPEGDPQDGSSGGTSDGGSSDGGTSTPASPVTITAISAEVAFDGEPPQFEVDPGSNGFYQIEVVTQSELFDENAHGSERDETNYFASWDGGPFMAESPYTLPQDAWDRLKHAERLYYRAWTSSSADAWADTATSLEDRDAANAPSIEITGGTSDGGTSEPSDRAIFGGRMSRDVFTYVPRQTSRRTVSSVIAPSPVIFAAESLPRDGDAPVFRIEPNGSPMYRVEVATSIALLNAAAMTEHTTYAESYVSPPQRVEDVVSSTTYTLPDDVWKAMRRASRIYYRVVVPTKAATANEGSASVPSIRLVDEMSDRMMTSPDDHDEGRWGQR